jgi:hypothetical protein
MKPHDLQTLALAALTGAPFRINGHSEPAEPAAVTAAAALAAKVDELGLIRAAIADLQTQADKIRTELEDAGLETMQGRFFTATLAQVKGRTSTDWAAIAARFKPSPQLIRAYTTTGSASTRLTIAARKINH